MGLPEAAWKCQTRLNPGRLEAKGNFRGEGEGCPTAVFEETDSARLGGRRALLEEDLPGRGTEDQRFRKVRRDTASCCRV